MATNATHVTRPSTARRILLDAFIPAARGAVTAPPPLLAWPAKDPGDVLDYQLDISPALIGNDGDTISTLDIEIAPAQPGDLAMNSAAADGASAIFWFTGGQPGITYSVSVNIGTTNGRNIRRTISLPVIPLSVTSTSALSLQTESGFPITDHTGSPVLTS